MSNFKLVAANKVASSIKSAVELKRNATISALFHGMVSSNVSFASAMTKTDMADFDTVLRQLLPMQWSKEGEKYVYSVERAIKSFDAIGLNMNGFRQSYKDGDAEMREQLVQEFYAECIHFYDAKAERKKAQDLDADALRGKALSKIKAGVKAAKEQGASDSQILDMLIGLGVNVQGYQPMLERTVKAA